MGDRTARGSKFIGRVGAFALIAVVLGAVAPIVLPRLSVLGLRNGELLLLQALGAALFSPVCCAPLLIPIGLVAVFRERPRWRGAVVAACGVVAPALGFTRGEAWFAEFDQILLVEVAEHSEPLVEAIRRYDTDHGRPPARLADLVPDYFPQRPRTGLRGYPEYDYRPNPGFGNRWVLEVSLGLDSLLYFESQEYGDSEVPRRIGDWIYVSD